MRGLLKGIFIMLLCWQTTSLFGQQDPQYTQYRYNLSVVNPAYAGMRGTLAINALYRRQWTSLEGSPETFTFGVHTPMDEKVGLGLSAIRDELGPVKETNLYGDFSYTLPMGGDSYLAMGIKAGVTLHEVGLAQLELTDPNDPFFSQDISRAYPNIGTGAIYYGRDYFLSLSVPNLLNSVHLDENGLKYGSEVNHFFLAGGYVFDVGRNEDILLRPSAMIKGAFKAPFTFDINFSALFSQKVEAGISYRLDDSIAGVVGFWVNPDIRIGYSYDYILSELTAGVGGSHEVIVTFDVEFREGRGIPPRFL